MGFLLANERDNRLIVASHITLKTSLAHGAGTPIYLVQFRWCSVFTQRAVLIVENYADDTYVTTSFPTRMWNEYNMCHEQTFLLADVEL